MTRLDLEIEGMHCGSCVAHVTRAIQAIVGATPETVEIGRAVVSYDEDAIDIARIQEALAEEGYPARPVTNT